MAQQNPKGPLRRGDRKAIENQIALAITNSKFKWRTAHAIARELDLDRALVDETLRHSDAFVKAKKPNARGAALYTTSKKYRSQIPLLGRLIAAGANTVTQ